MGRIPGAMAMENRTQALMGAERALTKAVKRPPSPFELHKPGTYPILNNPSVQSHVAIILANPRFHLLMRQSPRAAAALISEMMQSAQPDATGGY